MEQNCAVGRDRKAQSALTSTVYNQQGQFYLLEHLKCELISKFDGSFKAAKFSNIDACWSVILHSCLLKSWIWVASSNITVAATE